MWNNTITSKTVRHHTKTEQKSIPYDLATHSVVHSQHKWHPLASVRRHQTQAQPRSTEGESALEQALHPGNRCAHYSVRSTAHDPAISPPGYTGQSEYRCPPKKMLTNINSNIISGSPNQKTTQMLHRISGGIITKWSTTHQWEEHSAIVTHKHNVAWKQQNKRIYLVCFHLHKVQKQKETVTCKGQRHMCPS